MAGIASLANDEIGQEICLRQVNPPAKTNKIRKPNRTSMKGKMPSAEESAAIGRHGEVLVVRWEQKRLTECGRYDLAKRVQHVAVEVGDGEGYDVLSFDHISESPLHIEVKTTKGSQNNRFLISANEVVFAREHPKTRLLYRVFDLNYDPRFHILNALDDALLEPTKFRYNG